MRNWVTDQNLHHEDIGIWCAKKQMSIDAQFALHKVIGTYLGGESKMLAGASETHNPRKLKMHKSGFELWVLLKNNFDRASTFNVISSLRCGRNMQAAKCVCVCVCQT